MTEIIGVRFKNVGKVYSFDPNGLQIKKNDKVIVETARGVELGTVVCGNYQVEDEKVVQPLRKVLRLATDEDRQVVEKNREKEKKALSVCQKKILDHKLEMKCIDVEYTFDGSKILFYFTADGRVDFRELVKDLAGVFKTRIELRQVGVRDEAKMLGGLGICGKPFCCSTFLDDFQPVSIKMAKEQNLSLNPTKISGTCGRLMCCLKYEQEAYEDLHRTTPKVNTVVETPQGVGTVVDVSLLSGELKVRLEDSTDPTPKVFNKCEVCVKGSGGTCCARRKDLEQAVEAEMEKTFEEEGHPAHQVLEAAGSDRADRPPRERRPRPQGDRPRRQNQAARDGKEKNRGQDPMAKDAKGAGERAARQGADKQPGQEGKRPPRRHRPRRSNRPGEKPGGPQQQNRPEKNGPQQ